MQGFWSQIKKPIIGLSPMDGVTDFPMRKVQSLIGKPDVFYTEFISVEGFVRNPKHFEKKLFFENNQKPIVCQIFGYTPEAFYESIIKIVEKGFDGIDINMGCPAKSVLGKGGGGALIGNYSLAEKIISNSLKALVDTKSSIPLSVKTRIAKDSDLSKKWFEFLSGFPISEITVHGRRLKEGHSGSVDWDEISKAKEIFKNKSIVFLANGGIKSRAEAEEVCGKLDLDGILIGQAALGNPWIFKNIYSPTKEEILKTILLHSKLASEFYTPKEYVTVLKHFCWYPREFFGCKQLKIELLKTRSYPEVQKVIANFA